MRQYTSYEQTIKLIELGLSDSIREDRYRQGKIPSNYSVGELLEMLPKSIKVNDLIFSLIILSSNDGWILEYANISFGSQANCYRVNLIDALFDEIVMLKEEGII